MLVYILVGGGGCYAIPTALDLNRFPFRDNALSVMNRTSFTRARVHHVDNGALLIRLIVVYCSDIKPCCGMYTSSVVRDAVNIALYSQYKGKDSSPQVVYLSRLGMCLYPRIYSIPVLYISKVKKHLPPVRCFCTTYQSFFPFSLYKRASFPRICLVHYVL